MATQRAIDNWELLGSLALLWPRQRLVLAVHNALREEVDNTADEGERSALQLQLERVPALLARQRRRRDALSDAYGARVGVAPPRTTLRALVHSPTSPTSSLASGSWPTGATSRPKLIAAAMFGGPPVQRLRGRALGGGGDAPAAADDDDS